ncbi:MAG: LysR family transcriptional regulator [Clostridiales Family XIII bacterium]|jgi:DNA-binding transcriptional LysR family regulator|nr:LysR family transcriptional regulator [Clostridiales Family XIII bacterium]
MNLQYLKYAIEIEKAGSISKAAENLFLSQPNLSKDIKTLEDSMGIVIFERSKKGVSMTDEGRVFMEYAKNIVSQLEDMETHLHINSPSGAGFRISVPRASYIAEAFIAFVNAINPKASFNIYFMETDSVTAINNILKSGYDLGIVRYHSIYEKSTLPFVRECGLDYDTIFSSERVIIMNAKNRLAAKPVLTFSDLRDLIEIANNDFALPQFNMTGAGESAWGQNKKQISVCERGSRFDLLSRIQNSFMWVSPMPRAVLARNDLVQKKCEAPDLNFTDILIYKSEHEFSSFEKIFIDKLENVLKMIQPPL